MAFQGRHHETLPLRNARFALAAFVGLVVVASLAACGRSSIGRTNGFDGSVLENGGTGGPDDGRAGGGTGGGAGTAGDMTDTSDAIGADDTGTGGVAACAEPSPCEGYADGPGLAVKAVISCLSPSTATANAPLSLAIYGQHLATDPNCCSIVVLDDHTVLNGVPISACHLEVQISAEQIPTPKQVSVVVSPGGWTIGSAPAVLTLR